MIGMSGDVGKITQVNYYRESIRSQEKVKKRKSELSNSAFWNVNNIKGNYEDDAALEVIVLRIFLT